jgi:hypothetical protein
MSGNGWCTHPDRQVSSDVRILVRKAELACRNAWGSDLWEPANAEDAPAAQPAAQEPPRQPDRPAAIVYDDEITSVISADEHAASRPSLDDEVVEQSTISFRDDDYDYEQDERRDLLYRDSRSAIERARQRHARRNAAPVEPDDDGVIAEGDEVAETAASAEPPTFEPDDFIEEEAPTSTPVDEQDDALISEGIRTPSPRVRRLRRFRDERNDPKTEMATKTEPEPDAVELELPPSGAPERGRFDSIPEISADFDIPLLRRPSSAPEPKPAPEEAPDRPPASSSYDRALKRAHAMNQAARVEENQRRRQDVHPSANRADSGQAHPGMPDLPEVDVDPVSTGPSATSIELPTGTSAVLHPRAHVERIEEPDGRMKAQPRRAPIARRQPEPEPEARQSWWRGGQAARESEARDAAAMRHDDHMLPEERDTRHEPMETAVSFDLNRDEDLETFRSRLFAGEPEPAAEVSMSPPRGPISMSRRERRPIAPPVRKRREPPAELDDPRDTQLPAPRPRQRPSEEPERPVSASQRETRVAARVAPDRPLQDAQDTWDEPDAGYRFDVRDLINGDTELLDMTIGIAPDVPRACATCRNYRPGEQPGRGWCTNAWAFTHRQMVNEGDIACDSTIGCWWLPADEEVWLEEFEVAADATPRVDRLLARLDPERRAVGH